MLFRSSAVMELVNGLYNYKDKEQGTNMAVVKEAIESIVLLLAPFAPHITEELWYSIGYKTSVHQEKWPVHIPEALAVDEVTVVVQVNGKVRDKITVPVNMDKKEVEEIAKSLPKVDEYLKGKDIKKVVVIPNKLVNIVVGEKNS